MSSFFYKILLFSIFLVFCINVKGHQFCIFQGEVRDSLSYEILELVTVYVEEKNRWCYTDPKGNFILEDICEGVYTITIHRLGYKSKRMKVRVFNHSKMTFFLVPDNLQLSEVVVTATERRDGSTGSVIDRQAMQHLQPSGFADLLELLPGHVAKKQNMSGVQSMQLRQAGSDVNTALGTAIFIDDTPVSNDANLQYSANSSSDLKISNRINTVNGIDLRQISTDDIESVEIIRGLPSVRHGDLSSGAVLIKRKWGMSPTTIRAKADLNNKLFSIGKGFRLANQNGTLNFNTELLSHQNDPRNPLESYLRSTGSLRYFRPTTLFGQPLDLKGSIGYVFTLDKEKTDPELNYGQKDFYRSDYSRFNAHFDARWNLNRNFRHEISFRAASAITIDNLHRERYVTPIGPTPMPIAMEEGKGDAMYLPQGYESWLKIQGKPFHIFAQGDYTIWLQNGKVLHTQHMGIEWRYDNNLGKGEQYDLTRPPFPGRISSGRPRSFEDIPGLGRLSAYLEHTATIPWRQHEIIAQPGLRMAMLPGLSKDFAMHGKVYTDPRINVTWRFPEIEFPISHPFTIGINAAMGKLTRLPVMAHLFPHERYFHLMELNYFSQNPDLRRLYIMTSIEDPTNHELVPSVNLKKEIGMDMDWGKLGFNVTVFSEKMDNGFANDTRFVSLTHNQYDASSVSPTSLNAPPALDLFEYQRLTRIYGVGQYNNGSQVLKKGVEYIVRLPQINRIRTRFTLNGAWFKTRYHTTIAQYYSPGYIVNNEPYPYVGVYKQGSNSNEQQQFNTNLQADIHLPQYRLLLSFSVQNIWFTKRQQLWFDGLPIGFLDRNGEYHEFTPEHQQDHLLNMLARSFSGFYFDPEVVPIDTRVNMKISKEINQIVRFSFYVNNVLNYLPEYASQRSGVKVVRQRYPYFGMEINFLL
jgi:hypothetical protein